MTSEATGDPASPALVGTHHVEIEGKPVQGVQSEHSSQQMGPHRVEGTGIFGGTGDQPSMPRKSWAEIQREADEQEREQLRQAALHSHILRHRHHARRNDKASRFAGVTRGADGQWRAAIRHLPSGIKGSSGYLGTFAMEAQAATALDLMALACYETDAVTNFPPSRYKRVLTENGKRIMKAAFTVEHPAGRRKAREALAFLVRQVDQRGNSTSQ